MASSDNIRINTPGGTLYTVNGDSDTSTGLTLRSALSSIVFNNLGSGIGIYQGKGDFNVFNFKSIKAGEGALVTENDSTITVSLDTSAIKIVDDRYSKLSLLKDVEIDGTGPKKGEVLTFNGTNWAAESIVPDGLSSTVVFDLPIIIKAGAPGVTGFGHLPAGWTATVTDPSNPPYNITVNHPPGYYPISMSTSHSSVFDNTKSDVITIGTNMSSTSYIVKDEKSNSFMIYNASATNLKMSPDLENDQNAVIHIVMRKD